MLIFHSQCAFDDSDRNQADEGCHEVLSAAEDPKKNKSRLPGVPEIIQS